MKNLAWPKIAAILVIVVAVVYFGQKGVAGWQKSGDKVNADSYYAVFLNNNQVYFGHLSNVTDQYLSLTDIYYLQQTQPLQSTDAESTASLEDSAKQKLTLIKLGKELHGPKDEMRINRDNLLFFEELNSDSKVVSTIQKNKESQPK